jgi:hypothetical protein
MSEPADRTAGGRLFHARAAVTGKARPPRVVRLTVGSMIVAALLERRQRRASMSVVRRVVLARYGGAVPSRQR